MELTSKDGNMVVDFYPVKNWDNEIIHNRILKVLSFRGDKQKKMLISRDEFYYQVREYIKECKYKVTNEFMPAQFISKEVIAEATDTGNIAMMSEEDIQTEVWNRFYSLSD